MAGILGKARWHCWVVGIIQNEAFTTWCFQPCERRGKFKKITVTNSVLFHLENKKDWLLRILLSKKSLLLHSSSLSNVMPSTMIDGWEVDFKFSCFQLKLMLKCQQSKSQSNNRSIICNVLVVRLDFILTHLKKIIIFSFFSFVWFFHQEYVKILRRCYNTF